MFEVAVLLDFLRLGLSSSMTALQSSLEIAKEEIKKMKERSGWVDIQSVVGMDVEPGRSHAEQT